MYAKPTDDQRRAERVVLSVAYSADGKRLACGAMDGSVSVFDTATGTAIGALKGHYKPVRSLAFMPGKHGLKNEHPYVASPFILMIPCLIEYLAPSLFGFAQIRGRS